MLSPAIALASWHLSPPAYRLLVEQFIQREHQSFIPLALSEGKNGDRWIPVTKCQNAKSVSKSWRHHGANHHKTMYTSYGILWIISYLFLYFRCGDGDHFKNYRGFYVFEPYYEDSGSVTVIQAVSPLFRVFHVKSSNIFHFKCSLIVCPQEGICTGVCIWRLSIICLNWNFHNANFIISGSTVDSHNDNPGVTCDDKVATHMLWCYSWTTNWLLCVELISFNICLKLISFNIYIYIYIYMYVCMYLYYINIRGFFAYSWEECYS